MTSTMTTNLDTLEIQSTKSKTWRVFGKHEVVYTGGHVVYSRDHTHMICIHGEDPTAIVFYRLSSGQIVHQIDTGDDDPISTFALSPNQQQLYTAHIRSSLVKCWNIETKEVMAQWKSDHKNDIIALELDPTGTLIASASLDQSLRIRYANNGHLTHQFFNHGSPLSTIAWHPNVDKLLIAVGTQNGTIRVHWLGEGNSAVMGKGGEMVTSTQPKFIDLIRADYDGTPNKSHFSRVTSLAWTQCQTKLVSVGYDKTWRVWDFCYQFNTEQQSMTPKPQLTRSFDLPRQFQPHLSLAATEIASYLALDELEAVKAIPFGTPVPIRKKDTNEYVTKNLEEEANGAIYFITTGQRGVTTIWKVGYDYVAKKKQIGIAFKHTSLQSYSTQNIPYDTADYRSKLYAITTTGLNQRSAQSATDNDFDTPLHLQWHKLSIYLPASLLQSQQPMTNKVITLKDGRTITKPVPSKTIVIPQLPLLDTDKEYKQKLVDEMKFYESQDMLKREDSYRREARAQLQLENNLKMIDGDNTIEAESNDSVGESDQKAKKESPEEELDEEAKELQRQEEISRKLQLFRGLPSETPQIALINGDHNLYMMNMGSFDTEKIFSLYSLQINDVKLIPNSRCVVVATNSNQLRIFNIDTLNCSILFPHKDVIVSVTVSSCGRFIMSSTTKGEIFVWVLYHYDSVGFIPLDDSTQNEGESQNSDKSKVDTTIPTPFPWGPKRLASHISAHIVAELSGHTEAPSALAFSNHPSPAFEQRLISSNTGANRVDNPYQGQSKFITVPTVYNYNRMLLFACTGGSDKTVKTWNLSSLYVFVDPYLFPKWHQTSQYYKSVLLGTAQTLAQAQAGIPIPKLTPEQVISMTAPDNHIFVQLSDKTIANASYIMYHSLLYSTTTTAAPDTTLLTSQNTLTPPPTRIVFESVTTTLAHEKDINAITIHPNNTMIATCAEDKTCKIWRYNHSSTLVTSLQLLGVLKGHRRTVWQMIFTPREKFVITVSGDKMIKVWSTIDFSCVQTLQGHTAPVVQINWLRHGLQFMTGDSSGILRLWNLYDNNNGECVSVCDEPHEARINGLDIDHHRNDSFMVTGDTAAKLVFWHDTTLYDEMMAKQQEQTTMLLTQLLENALKHKDLLKAFELALKLNHPRNLYQILSDIIDNEQRYKRWKALKVQRDKNRALLRAFKIKQAEAQGNRSYDPETDPDIVGQDELYLTIEARENLELRVPKPKITVKKLVSIRTNTELESLMNMVLDWNTNSKFSFIAQYVLNTMTTSLAPEVLVNIPHFDNKVEIFISYSQRHYTRTTNLLQSSYLVDHVLSNMNIYMPLHEQERANKIMAQQSSMELSAGLFGGSNTGSAADWLIGSSQSHTEGQALQHILSLQVDDSLMQYEDISDDEEGLGVIAAHAKKTQRQNTTQKRSNVNYYYGSNMTDPYASSSESDDWSDESDEDDEDDLATTERGGLADELVGEEGDKIVQLKPIPAIAMPSFDSTWGDFDDDWESMANAAPVVENTNKEEKKQETKPKKSAAATPATTTTISTKTTALSTKSTALSTKSTPLSTKSTPLSTKSTPLSTKTTALSTKSTALSTKPKESPSPGQASETKTASSTTSAAAQPVKRKRK